MGQKEKLSLCKDATCTVTGKDRKDSKHPEIVYFDAATAF